MSLRSRSRSPDTSNKRAKYSRDDDRRHHVYRYEDDHSSRSRHRDDRDTGPRLYRVDGNSSRDHRRDGDRDRYRDDRHRYRDDDDRRSSDRRHQPHHSYEDDKRRHSDRDRERDRDRDRNRGGDRERDRERSRDGRRANGAPISPRQSTDVRSSRSPQQRPSPAPPASRIDSPSEVLPSLRAARPNGESSKTQMTDVQRARMERMELWKKKKAAEAAAKSGISTQDATNVPSPTVRAFPAPGSPQGTSPAFYCVKRLCSRESCIFWFRGR